MFVRCLAFLFAVTLFGLPAPALAAPSPSGTDFEAHVLDIIRRNPEAILDAVRTYRERKETEKDQIRAAYGHQLRADPAVVIAGAPMTAPLPNRVVLLEFSDFQCPYCAALHSTLDELLARYPNDITLAYKHLPLSSLHPQARVAARAAWAAQQQGVFWSYHDALFAREGDLDASTYRQIATNLGLDLNQFDHDFASAAAEAAIERDIAQAEAIQLSGTPALFVGDRFFEGAVPLADLEAIITEQIAHTKTS